jgi:hypothetical protein
MTAGAIKATITRDASPEQHHGGPLRENLPSHEAELWPGRR